MNSKVKIKKMTEEDLFSKDDSLRIREKALDQCIDELEAVQQFYIDNPKFIIDGSLAFIVCLIDYLKELKTLKEKMQKLRERFEDFCAEECAICALEQTDKIEESNFSTEQYKADLQSAYECGYQHGYADAWNDECSSDNVIT